MINVTQTFLPPIEEYNNILKRAWDKKWLTNRGELVCELEDKIKSQFDINHCILMTNGTLPIQIALKILGDRGEIITTPFSYVATTSSIVWEGCIPVFVDIHPEYLTIDETKIESAITEKTTAILATHVFGNPCDVEAIEKIAKKYNLYVIYDAAHCFGVTYKGQGIFNYGDVSTCSFHATKIFHTGEGGALFCNNKAFEQQMFYSHNFGHNGHEDFFGMGINAKISELQAAMGLAVLPYFEEILKSRKNIFEYYKDHIDWSKYKAIKVRDYTEWNYSYFPIIFETEKELLNVISLMNRNNIKPRRYFYPSLNKLSYLNRIKCKISEDISKRILCLPLYYDLSDNQLDSIIKHL